MPLQFDNDQQAQQAMSLAIGRIFVLGSRPTTDGDIKKYEDAKYVIFCAAEHLGIIPEDKAPSYQKDYFKIHQD